MKTIRGVSIEGSRRKEIFDLILDVRRKNPVSLNAVRNLMEDECSKKWRGRGQLRLKPPFFHSAPPIEIEMFEIRKYIDSLHLTK